MDGDKIKVIISSQLIDLPEQTSGRKETKSQATRATMPETDGVLEKSTSDTAIAQITSVNKILFKTLLAWLPDC